MGFWLPPDPVVKETMDRKSINKAAHWTQDRRLLVEEEKITSEHFIYSHHENPTHVCYVYIIYVTNTRYPAEEQNSTELLIESLTSEQSGREQRWSEWQNWRTALPWPGDKEEHS